MTAPEGATIADLPLPPRVVRGGPGATLWFRRIFILPHMLVGLIVGPAAILLVLLWLLFGAQTTGHLLGDSISFSRKGEKSRDLIYTYDGSTPGIVKSTSVSANDAALLAPETGTGPREVRVNHFELGPVQLSSLVDVEPSPLQSLGLVTLFFAFWNGILAIFLRDAWVEPHRRKRLVALGTATPGRLISKRSSSGRSATYYVSYDYQTAAGEHLEREMSTSREMWTQAEVHDAVTVLYWPEQPRRSTVYELGYYRAEASAPASNGARTER